MRDALKLQYETRYTDVLRPLAADIEGFIKAHFSTAQRIDRIVTRAKSVDRFLVKATKIENGVRKYPDPLNQIQDQIGARIVTFYKSDVEFLAGQVPKFFRSVEDKALVPDSPKEFGYEGRHFVLFVPEDVLDEAAHQRGAPVFFELQIKTLFQYAWSEAEHDLGYKPETPLTIDQKRRVAFTAAQAWGADQIFDELFAEVSRGKSA